MALPIENLLRKPVEWVSTVSYGGLAVLLTTWPSTFYLQSSVAWLSATGLAALAVRRASQATKLMRYQARLRRPPFYSMSSDGLPVSPSSLFLGRGFRWSKKHTTRLVQLQEPENERFRLPPRRVQMASDLVRWLEIRGQMRWLQAQLKSGSSLNPFRPLPPTGGTSTTHGVGLWEGESDFYMSLSERVGHTLVLGTTRVGKTRFAELMIAQDIRRGNVVIVFDPKGDLDLLKRMWVEADKAGRLDQFTIFHLGHPELSARYNPIDSIDRITEVATRVSNQLPSEGQSAAFKEFVWRFVNVIARTTASLGDRISYQTLYRIAAAPGQLAIRYFEQTLTRHSPNWQEEFEDPFEIAQQKKEEGQRDDELTATLRQAVAAARSTKRELRALALSSYIQSKEITDDISSALATMLTNDRAYFDKLVSSLYPLLEKLTTGRVAELVSPKYDDVTDKRTIFTWADVVNRSGIVYVGLDALSDHEVASVVGNAMFADLTSLAGTAYKHGYEYGQSRQTQQARRVSIHADEFNELIGDEFVPMVNKAGGAGFEVTAYTQTWADVEARIGSRAKAEQIAGNFNTLFMLRVKNTDTARILTDQLPEISVPTKTLASAATDTNHPGDFSEFTTKNEDRLASVSRPMLMPSEITSLPKGEAFGLIEGGQLVKLRFPLPDAKDFRGIPDSIADLCHQHATGRKANCDWRDLDTAIERSSTNTGAVHHHGEL
jgi:conjugative coupling factor TraD (TOL family)